jgi:outer membrane protein TolC
MEIFKKYLFVTVFVPVAISVGGTASGQQTLSLKQALQIAISNYGTIQAKASYAAASRATIVQAKRDYLPNLNVSAQTDYGTANGQNGPLYGLGGLGVTSTGPPLAAQNWNAAFGSLYLANVNWDFFTFGRSKEKIHTAKALADRDEKDWQQEIFQHEVRVAAAYLNLLAAKRLTASYKKNLDRADTFRYVVISRALNELIPGVDSSQANAEVSNAKITLTRALDAEQEQANQLAQLLGVPAQDFAVDTLFIAQLPASMKAPVVSAIEQHPLLQWYKSRIEASDQLAKYDKTFSYPAFSLLGVIQTRGSGFSNSYTGDPSAVNHNLYDGIQPARGNYLIAVGVTWNLTQPLRISQQVKSQQLISKGLREEYNLVNEELTAQLQLSGTKISNALDTYREAPMQVQAASDAYRQKSVMYQNGLTNLVDVTQALYALVRAETDRDIAYNNVWQALLLKAAATGDFTIFSNNL